jgi:hypothetical protein
MQVRSSFLTKPCEQYSGFHIRKSRLGIALGLIAAAVAIPLSSQRSSSADNPSKTTANRILTEDDREMIEKMAGTSSRTDLRPLEEKWAETVWTTIRQRLISLYKTERSENEKIRSGLIKQEDRKVKIFYGDFVGPGETGDDGGSELNLHVVKYYDNKQPDGNILRTYVNEHWPINEETGGILPTEAIRVRAQVFKGPLNEPGAEKYFITDQIQIIWGTNFDGSKGNARMFPYFHRQRLYGGFDQENKVNLRNQLQVPVSSPKSCMSCHHSGSTFTEDIFLRSGEKKVNFGGITPDREFTLPFDQHRGYLKYKKYLDGRVKAGEIKDDYRDRILKSLQNSTSVENPSIVEGLDEAQSIQWFDGDTEIDHRDQATGFKYTANGKTWVKAPYYQRRGELFINDWWARKDLQLIP